MVGAEIMGLLKPLGIEAALGAVEARKTEAAEKRGQLELALKQARYEAALARRQYDAVDPDNRLVASELERRWNEKLIAVRQLEDEFEAVEQQRPLILGDEEWDRLLRLGADLETAWSHPAATMATRKRIIRAVLHEIVVRVENGFVDMVLHWRGGDHTALKVKKNAAGIPPSNACAVSASPLWPMPSSNCRTIPKPPRCRTPIGSASSSTGKSPSGTIAASRAA